MKEPSEEAMTAARGFIDRIIAINIEHGSSASSPLRREESIYEVAKVTDRWIKFAQSPS